MRGFSKVILAGNVTRDPEMRTTPSGSQVCGFGLAVNRNWRDQNGNNQESVSFFDCTVWGKSGEVVMQYVKKGTAILVSGRLEQRSWDDKATGQKRTRVEVTVDDFNLLGSRNDDDSVATMSQGSASAATSAPAASAEVTPVDIPENVNLEEIPF